MCHKIVSFCIPETFASGIQDFYTANRLSQASQNLKHQLMMYCHQWQREICFLGI